MKTIFAPWLAGFFLLACPVILPAQNDGTVVEPNIFSRLQQYEPLHVVIETDLKKLRQETKEETWQAGIFKIMNGKTVAFEQAVQVAARGNMRKKTCDFPPLKIRFYHEKPENDSLADINELKLVVSCRNSANDDQLVMRECFAYALYNLFTDESFRVKPATLEVKNPGRKRSNLKGTAFFIESEKELAARLGGRPLKPRIISPKIMDSTAYLRMCLFEFMIGNTDWGAYTRHNIKVIGITGRSPVAIPYDFDYSGLVAADYAVPSPDIPIASVAERYFLGLCASDRMYRDAFGDFQAQKSQILQLCREYSGLNSDSRAHMQDYLNGFFDLLDDPVRVKKYIIENCNKRVKPDD